MSGTNDSSEVDLSTCELQNKPVKIVAEHVDTQYQNYLLELRNRNRHRLLMNRKSRDSIRRERLEQGFTLYFNSAPRISNNSTSRKTHYEQKLFSVQSSRKAKAKPPHMCNSNVTHNKRTTSAPQAMTGQRRKAWNKIERPRTNTLSPEHNRHLSSLQISNDVSIDEADKDEGKSVPMLKKDDDVVGLNDLSEVFCRNNSSFNAPQNSYQTCTINVQLDIMDNWGDPNKVSLQAIQVLFGPGVASHLKNIWCNSIRNDGNDGDEICSDGLEQIVRTEFTVNSTSTGWMTTKDRLPLRITLQFTCYFHKTPSDLDIQLRLFNSNDSDLILAGVRQCGIPISQSNFPSSREVLYGEVKKVNNLSSEQNATTFTLKYPFEPTKLNEECVVVCRSQFEPAQTYSNVGDKLSLNDREPTTREEPCIAVKQKNKYDWLAKSITEHSDSRLSDCYLLSKVSKELLERNSEKYESSPLLSCSSNRIRSNNLLEESWTSLNFFNHFHAGRLVSDSLLSAADPRKQDLPHARQVSSPVQKEEQMYSISTYLFTAESKEDLDNSRRSVETAFSQFQTKILCPRRPLDQIIRIPELPLGRVLIFDIVSTWGDVYYVGLSGIEIFTSDGMEISSHCEISADPSDINILPGYGQDPRVVQNLIDSMNWTRDDVHMWLAPFTAGARHLIRLSLPSWSKQIALLRIWNYNKSRVHTSRGVREMIIYLDDKPIFQGEIRRASGLESGDPEDFSETILFTTDDAILERIAVNDKVLSNYNGDINALNNTVGFSTETEKRPVTVVPQKNDSILKQEPGEETGTSCLQSGFQQLSISTLPVTASLELTLLDTWAIDSRRIGLTGLELLDAYSETIPVEEAVLLNEWDMSHLPIDRLFDNHNETTDCDHMWSCDFQRKSPPRLLLKLGREANIFAIRIWNYNNRQVDEDYGVKLLKIVDNLGRVISRIKNNDVLLIRRAPGHSDFPFVQEIQLKNLLKSQRFTEECGLLSPEFPLDSLLPCGFVYQLQIYSAWHDKYYVGLNGLELIDMNGAPVSRNEFSIFASPSSVNELHLSSLINPDVRTVDKLTDGINSGKDMAHHCWLTPILPNKLPCIYVVFNEPMKLAGIRLWNYTRTRERGVREFAVFVDDQLVFRGYLPKASDNNFLSSIGRNSFGTRFMKCRVNGILPTCDPINPTQSSHYYLVAFDHDVFRSFGEDPQFILGSEDSMLAKTNVDEDAPFLLTNIDRWRQTLPKKPSVFSGTNMKAINQTLRPFTCVSSKPVNE
ncbi:hypothetical protein EG68_09121 [Paragonimus skrjabini miyazakii]|uniref:KATNIP domain-containing protein n=1 Tax=Paragonimus skrjabini miyazakii TaxID=59628 RepID=A0A8S9YI41_9TREM|nr:hypothetical protein EG68_09121 [Paragonimus skrjabini miyazakii]